MRGLLLIFGMQVSGLLKYFNQEWNPADECQRDFFKINLFIIL